MSLYEQSKHIEPIPGIEIVIDKNISRRTDFWAASTLLAFSAAIYARWCFISPHSSFYGRLSAGLCLILFDAVCLRFIPVWRKFWMRDNVHHAEAAALHEPRFTELKIFISVLIFSIFTLIIVWQLRRMLVPSAANQSFTQSLEFWRCLDNYMYLAEHWYQPDGQRDYMVLLVFPPGYPTAVRLLSYITNNVLYAGFTISALCFSLCGIVMYKLLRLDMSHTAAIRSVWYLCIIPGAFFFSALMSDSMFVFLCALCLYLARTKRWFAACATGALASFTRVLGITLCVPLFMEAVHEWSASGVSGRDTVRRTIMIALVPCGLAVYLCINYIIAGDPLKFMEYQRVHWHQQLSYFINTASYHFEYFLNRFDRDLKTAVCLHLANLTAIFLPLILTISSVKKLRASFAAWFIAYYTIAIGPTWLLSGPRYMIGFFPLAASLALISDSRKTHAVISMLCIAASALYLCAFVMRWQVW